MNIKSINNVYNRNINFVGKKPPIQPAVNSTNVVKAKKPRVPITIQNFHKIDSNVWRGAKPTEAEVAELHANGVKRIISFCTNYNPQTRQVGKMPEEANWAKKLGMDFYWMPFKSNENPPEKYIKDFFKIIDDANKKGEKVFIHCRHGKDRTGLFSALYRLRNRQCSLSDAIRQLMKYGHDANNNPNIIPFLVDFEETLNYKLPKGDFKRSLTKLVDNTLKTFRRIK